MASFAALYIRILRAQCFLIKLLAFSQKTQNNHIVLLHHKSDTGAAFKTDYAESHTQFVTHGATFGKTFKVERNMPMRSMYRSATADDPDLPAIF